MFHARQGMDSSIKNTNFIRQEEEHRSLTVTPTEDRALVDNYWEICQTPRRKISLGCIYYERELDENLPQHSAVYESCPNR